jgi:hypothetical protein
MREKSGELSVEKVDCASEVTAAVELPSILFSAKER